MKTSPYIPFYGNDFIQGTLFMSAEQAGALIRLLCFQWDQGGLPDDVDKLQRISGISGPPLAEVLEKFPRCPDDGLLKNTRMEVERARVEATREKQFLNGIKGGRPRAPVKSSAGGAANPPPDPAITQNKAIENPRVSFGLDPTKPTLNPNETNQNQNQKTETETIIPPCPQVWGNGENHFSAAPGNPVQGAGGHHPADQHPPQNPSQPPPANGSEAAAAHAPQHPVSQTPDQVPGAAQHQVPLGQTPPPPPPQQHHHQQPQQRAGQQAQSPPRGPIDMSVWEPTPDQITVAGWFDRAPDTPWNRKERRRWLSLQMQPDDMEILLWFYTRSGCTYLRHDLQSLLNSWRGEVDRARNFARSMQP